MKRLLNGFQQPFVCLVMICLFDQLRHGTVIAHILAHQNIICGKLTCLYHLQTEAVITDIDIGVFIVCPVWLCKEQGFWLQKRMQSGISTVYFLV